MSAVVVQMHGEPGSGKSAVASAIAPALNAIVLDKDVIKSALLRVGLTNDVASSAAYEVYFDIARSLAGAGRALILDNPVFWPRVEANWLRLCADAGSPPILIECVCPDREVLAHRLASRGALASQPREPLDLVRYPGAAPTEFCPRLAIDTRRPMQDLVPECVAFVRSRLAGVVLPCATESLAQ